VTATRPPGRGGRRRPGWPLPDATAPAAALAAAGLAWRWRRGTWRPLALLAGAAAIVAVLVVAPEVVGGPDTAVRAAAAPRAVQAGTSAAAHHPVRRAAARPTPGPGRVVLVIEENHEFGQIIGSPRAPFLNRLAAHGTLLTRYFAVTHPSLPNYVALVAGSPLGIRNDCRLCHRPGRTLVDQLERARISWKAYYQGLPAPCSSVVEAGAYAKKTNPFAHLDDVRASPARCHRVVPLDRLRPDLRQGRLPRFAVIVPDLQHDMHSGPVSRADAFLRRLYRELAASSSWRPGSVLVVTFDEGLSSRGIHGPGGGRVATIVAGPGVPRRRDPTRYSHYALLRSIEHRFGLPPIRYAADWSTMTIPAIAGPRSR
jgi:hypothetical protein